MSQSAAFPPPYTTPPGAPEPSAQSSAPLSITPPDTLPEYTEREGPTPPAQPLLQALLGGPTLESLVNQIQTPVDKEDLQKALEDLFREHPKIFTETQIQAMMALVTASPLFSLRKP